MAQKLLHTLVFASTMILEGCAHSVTPNQATTDTNQLDGGVEVDAAISDSSEDAASAADTATAMDTTPDTSVDPRLCDLGWPTTKGGGGCETDRTNADGDTVVLCSASFTDEPYELTCKLERIDEEARRAEFHCFDDAGNLVDTTTCALDTE